MSGAAIVSTVRSPGVAPLLSWARYHREIGFERLYLFFDPDDTDAARISDMPGVKVITLDDEHRARMRSHPFAARYAPLLFETGAKVTSPDALTSMQLCNMAAGLDLAREDGMSWLLHLDVDEAFHAGEMSAVEHFAHLDALGMGQARYINHEGLAERAEHDDYFAEMTLFKRNPSEVPDETLARNAGWWADRGGYFLAYTNGKAAVRVIPGVTPATAHGFQLPKMPFGRCSLSTPCILHHPYTSFERYWAKHARLGDFTGDTLLGQRWRPPEFLLMARDYVRDEQKELALSHYLRAATLTDPARVAELVAEGVLVRIDGPARKIAGWKLAS